MLAHQSDSNQELRTSSQALLPGLSDDFEYLGHYEPTKFVLVIQKTKEWRGVYVWVHDTGDMIVPLRVGMTWGKYGLAGRYGSYNSWLAGTFKPYDAREQAVRRFTIEGAGRGMIVVGCRTSTKADALALEAKLRAHWAKHLSLDLKASGSLISKQMQAWRTRSK